MQKRNTKYDLFLILVYTVYSNFIDYHPFNDKI